ncbi:MAG: ATP-binding cassette domain-containing protein [Lachnospiraceae bacterium]|nr:ATP-binding cassette domain-containing protein [Lachnospiraceae bacterium]
MNWNNVSDKSIYEICKIVCIDDFVHDQPQKLDFHLDAKGKNISGGQKQRIALAKALIRNPQILLLDEATSALDIETEKKVIIGILKYREGLTTLMVAHRKETIKLNKNIIKIN